VEVLWSHDGAGWFGQGLTLSQKLSPKLPVALSLIQCCAVRKEKKKNKEKQNTYNSEKNKKKIAGSPDEHLLSSYDWVLILRLIRLSVNFSPIPPKWQK
jgi:hypothetical protein